ncbi:outer membrane protein TolC [Sinorhizobium terangae]|nr:outer membrane protein TolC [Sinorhizobium terangae]
MKAAVGVAKAERDQHFFIYQSTVLNALEDVQNAIVSLNKSRARAASLAESVSGYRLAAKYSRDLLAAGESDLFDVLDADRSLYSAQEQLIQANADIATNYVSLNKALGGGWSGPIDVTVPRVEDGFVGPHLAMRKTGR